MDQSFEEWINLGLKVTPVFILLIFWKRIMNMFSWLKDGINKKEFAALIFIGILLYMFHRDGTRDHEWSYFTDIQYMMCYLFISVGLGLNDIIEAIYAFKGKKRENTEIGNE